MLDFIYEFLPKIGYHHPIHPTEVHMPIGLVVGAIVFQLAGLLLRRPMLARAARYCVILALLWLFPTIFLGILDWQHYYKGAWLFAVKMKFILTGLLIVLLVVAVVVSRRAEAVKTTLSAYSLCFLAVVLLGYWGGELVLGGRSPVIPEEFTQAASLFEQHCASCHPGGAASDANVALRHTNQCQKFDLFLGQIRSPKQADGSSGDMPPFDAGVLSDEEAWKLYQYVVHVLGCACPIQ